MKNLAESSGWRERFPVAFAAGFTLLGFTLVNFLNYNGYPLLRRELVYFYAGLLLLCGAMAALYVRRSHWSSALLEALLVGVIVDLNLDSIWLTVAAFLSSFLFLTWKRTSLLPSATMMGAVMFVLPFVGVGEKRSLLQATVTKPAAELRSHRQGQPAIVHLIFDEHTGFEGFPFESTAANKMKADLRLFYASRRFAMFGRAYSEHYYTANSIPQILNLGGPAPTVTRPEDFVPVRPTKYINFLHRQGYSIHIYQTDVLDLCKYGAAESCTMFNTSAVGSLLHTPLSTSDRAQLVLFNLLRLSDVLLMSDQLVPTLMGYVRPDSPIMPPLEQLGIITPIASSSMLDRLAIDLADAKPGHAYIAHVLLPHFPSAMDHGCRIRPLRRWDRRVLLTAGSRKEIIRQERDSAYFDQLRCTLAKTDRLLKSLERSPAGKNSVVIVNGDHGSRMWENIPDKRYYRLSNDADYIAGFSTLFAVRAPLIETTYVEQAAPVADLLRQLTASGFTALPKPRSGRPLVWLADADWHPWKQVQLPSSWQEKAAQTSRSGSAPP